MVEIGSARIDENGDISGGVAGDQKQRSTPDYSGEVSREGWYRHSKGWVVLRAKDAEKRRMIAEDMRRACDNPHIGYNQDYNYTLYQVAKPLGFDCGRVAANCSTDCARLVRVCVLYAGIPCKDFYTGNEADALMATGEFDKLTESKYTETADYLLEGDILVTRTKGHTVVVLSNGDKAVEASGTVAEFQSWLNHYYPDLVKAGTCGFLLDVDDSYGPLTRAASVTVWKHMANKYYGSALTIGNVNFYGLCKTVAAKIDYEEIEKHPTLAVLLQGELAGAGYYTWTIDGGYTGQKVRDALSAFNAEHLISGDLTAQTWYELYNQMF